MSLALRRLAALVRPGGVLAVVGFARLELRELPWDAMAFVARGVAVRVHGKWEHTAPIVWPPADTLRQVKRAAADELPGASVRRLLFGRYLLGYQLPRSNEQRMIQ